MSCDQFVMMHVLYLYTFIKFYTHLKSRQICMFQKPNNSTITMLSRSVRAETRQSRKEDIKRVMHSIDKVIDIVN